MGYFGVLSLGAQDSLLKWPPSPATFVGDEDRAPPAISAVANDVKDDDDWDLEGAVGLDNVERVGAKRHLRKLQDSCRAKKRKVPGPVAEAFEFSTQLVNRKAPAGAGPSNELASVKDALATPQSAVTDAKNS